jgi:hypothetical protein
MKKLSGGDGGGGNGNIGRSIFHPIQIIGYD